MKKEDDFSVIQEEISNVNHFLRVLENHIEKFEVAYLKKDHEQFNKLKKEIIQIQKKIQSIIK